MNLPAFSPDSPIDPSADRCAHADTCNGCPRQGIPYPDQLVFKHGRVFDALARHPHLRPVSVQPVAPADPPAGYRMRAKLMVAAPARIGLYGQHGGHDVVDIPACRVLTPTLFAVVHRLRGMLADGTLGLSAGECLVAVDLREVRNGDERHALLTLVLRRDRKPSSPELAAVGARILAAIPEVRGVAVNLREPSSVQVLGSETTTIAGSTVLRDSLGAAYHHATFGAFAQAHRGQAARVHGWIAAELRRCVGRLDHVRVLELYGGSGPIGLELAAAGATVDLVESFGPAARQALQAASEQGFAKRFHVVVNDAARAMRGYAEAGARFDALLVNPPRRGLAPEVRRLAGRLGIKAIGYVSCDPDTLARDLSVLQHEGFRPVRVAPLDMIPMTDEVETFAWLERGAPPVPSVLFDDAGLLVIDKPPHQAVLSGDPQAWTLLKRLGREDAAVPWTALDVMDRETSGVVRVHRKGSGTVPALAARELWLVMCRGVAVRKGKIPGPHRGGEAASGEMGGFRRLAVLGGHSLLRVTIDGPVAGSLEIGLAKIGLPVIGDRKNGHEPTNAWFEERNGLDRAFLHRLGMEFAHPTTAARVRVEAPLPGDLRTCFARMGETETIAKLEAAGWRSDPLPERARRT